MPVKISVADVRIGWSKEELAAGVGHLKVRLSTNPQGFCSIGPGDPVGPLFDTIVKELGGQKIDLLSIFAHGYAVEDASKSTHGGYGMQFGKDDIVQENAAALFGKFKGKFASAILGIELVGCEVAQQSRVRIGRKVEVGDGLKLCQTIAKAAGTYVRASPSAQSFASIETITASLPDATSPVGHSYMKVGDVVETGGWEGNVWLIGPTGKVK